MANEALKVFIFEAVCADASVVVAIAGIKITFDPAH
jgi:hypothetical protein